MKTLSILILICLFITNDIYATCSVSASVFLNRREDPEECPFNEDNPFNTTIFTVIDFYAIRWSDNTQTYTTSANFRAFGQCQYRVRCYPNLGGGQSSDHGTYALFTALAINPRFGRGGECVEDFRSTVDVRACLGIRRRSAETVKLFLR